MDVAISQGETRQPVGTRPALSALEILPAPIQAQFKFSRDISLIWIERRGIAPARDLLGRVFIALGQASVPVLLISHASWEGNCCFVVPAILCMAALDALNAELEGDFDSGDVTRLNARNDVILLTAESASARDRTRQPTDSTRVYERLAGQGVNILVTAHDVVTGSLSVVLASQDQAAALAALQSQVGKINPVPKVSVLEGLNGPKVSLSPAI